MSSKPIIVVLDDFERVARDYADWSAVDPKAVVRVYREALRGQALVDALTPASAVVLMRDRTPFMAELIDKLPNLKLVHFTGTRNGALDTKALAARGIPVLHTSWGPNKDATTEMTWALILAAQKRLVSQHNALLRGQWRPHDTLSPVLHGQRIGIAGLGEIGGRVASVARAFGMDVVAWSPNMTPERAAAKGAAAVSFDELVATSHVITTHLVLGPAVEGKSVRFRVTIDGQAPGPDHGIDTDEQGNGEVTSHRLYQLVRQKGAIKDCTFIIEFLDPGVQAFAFTFG